MTKPIVAFRDFPKAPNNNYNFPTFGTIYDLAMATPIECAGQENGKPHLKLILLHFITLLLESISNLLAVLLWSLNVREEVKHSAGIYCFYKDLDENLTDTVERKVQQPHCK